MCCKNFWKKIISFAVAFFLGLSAASLLRNENPAGINREIVIPIKKDAGSGSSGRSGVSFGESTGGRSVVEKKLSILSKPRANYTDQARQNGTEGTVRVRVTFLASGEIGAVTPVNNLPDGLTGQAMAAARQIKFEPATRGGVPITVTKIVEYSFTLY